MDEIFGRVNFVASVLWRAADSSNNDSKKFSIDHNYILVYSLEPNRVSKGSFAGVGSGVDIGKVVAVVTQTLADKTIPIPKIVVLPKRQVSFNFEDFDLNGLDTINYRPIGDDLLIEDLRTGLRTTLARFGAVQYELRPEDYIVGPLIERDEIAYDDCADLLYKLAGQIVQRLRSYLATQAEVENILIAHSRTLADFIFAQMM
jgi:type III restriction enzyme